MATDCFVVCRLSFGKGPLLDRGPAAGHKGPATGWYSTSISTRLQVMCAGFQQGFPFALCMDVRKLTQSHKSLRFIML